MEKVENKTILAGDIGATKTILALYPLSGTGAGEALTETKYRNDDFDSFEEMVGDFLSHLSPGPETACFGIAGPVLGNRVTMTNRNWVVNASSLQAEYGFSRVELINDLVATALGTTVLGEEEILTINTGRSQSDSNIAVIAPGTGLGESFLTISDDGLLAHASEGGHSSFAPRNEQQIALWRYVHLQHEHVSTELVCSGRALPELYAFLKAGGGFEFEQLDEELDRAHSLVPGIIHAALEYEKSHEQSHRLAGAVLSLFLDILAAEAANLALKVLALGGVFIGGGIMPRIVSLVDPSLFMDIFSQGVYGDMLSAIPVHIILNPRTALLGAVVKARDIAGKDEG